MVQQHVVCEHGTIMALRRRVVHFSTLARRYERGPRCARRRIGVAYRLKALEARQRLAAALDPRAAGCGDGADTAPYRGRAPHGPPAADGAACREMLDALHDLPCDWKVRCLRARLARHLARMQGPV